MICDKQTKKLPKLVNGYGTKHQKGSIKHIIHPQINTNTHLN